MLWLTEKDILIRATMYAQDGAYPSRSFCRPVRQARDEAKIVAPAACRSLELRKKATSHDDREIHTAEDGPVNADLAPKGTLRSACV